MNRLGLDISLIVPAYNEEASIASVLHEAADVLDALSFTYEIIVVNDGSTDGTAAVLTQCMAAIKGLRVFSLMPNAGQSAAFGAGFGASRGQVVVMMDGDGQNDPKDIPALLGALKGSDACCGYRVARRDTWSKRIGGRIANGVRRRILHDDFIDAGCSLKAVKAEFVRDLPMRLRGMHRFLPVLWSLQGAAVTQIPVNHRDRMAGRSKYTNSGRLRAAIHDVWAIRWMQHRYQPYRVREESSDA